MSDPSIGIDPYILTVPLSTWGGTIVGVGVGVGEIVPKRNCCSKSGSGVGVGFAEGMIETERFLGWVICTTATLSLLPSTPLQSTREPTPSVSATRDSTVPGIYVPSEVGGWFILIDPLPTPNVSCPGPTGKPLMLRANPETGGDNGVGDGVGEGVTGDSDVGIGWGDGV